MITDSLPLLGDDAYLRTADGNEVIRPGDTGWLGPVRDGVSLSIQGLVLHLEGFAPLGRFRRHQQPLLSITTTKELVEGLFLDPYALRMHALGGGEDLAAGPRGNAVVATVDGVETLISEERGEVSWQSAAYVLAREITIAAAYWDLHPRADALGFTYGLELLLWADPAATSAAPDDVVELCPAGTGAAAVRGIALDPQHPARAQAFAVRFVAEVLSEGPLRLHDESGSRPRALGQPLLRSVRIAEQVPSTHAYHSLGELFTASSQFLLLPPGAAEPDAALVVLDYSARLEDGESLTVELPMVPGVGAMDRSVQVRALGVVSERPPRASR